MRAVFLKEFFRLKLFLLFLSVCFVLFLIWFGFDFVYKFKAIHPESVIWYQYVFLDNKPEQTTIYAIIFLAVMFALAQFLPQKNHIKCLLHLPISNFKILIWHYAFALLFFAIVWLFGGLALFVLVYKFYPAVIYHQILIAWTYFWVLAASVYAMTSAVIIDSNTKRQVLLGALYTATAFMLVFYVSSFFIAVILFFVSIVLGYNSLISHKQNSIKKQILYPMYAVVVLIFVLGAYKFYDKHLLNKFEKYYIFYSPTLKEFIYQENLGGHYFAYKTSSGGVFEDEISYKNELPFNYYMDLKQQNKLPAIIDSETFDEASIRNTRASTTLNSKDITKLKIKLYPLFNPNPKISAIPFSEDMLYLAKDKFLVYHHDGDINKNLSDKINKEARVLGVKFPIVDAFGRFNNLKPFDAGIFLKDSNEEFFNIKIYNNQLSFTKLDNLKNLRYLHISESKNSPILGLGFKDNDIYLFDKNHSLNKLDINGFDFSNFRLRVSFDPKYLQVRFDNGEIYRVFAFDRADMKKIGEFKMK